MSETRIYGFRVPAGGLFPLDVHGDNFLIKSSSGQVSVKWQGGFLANLAAGQGQKVPTGFHRLDLTNSGSVEVYGEILISDENFIDKRITGDVSVIDGEKARSLAAGRFFTGAELVSVNFNAVQLWNPSTTHNLIVTSVEVSCNGISDVGVLPWSAALANDVTASFVTNALIGSPVGLGQIRREGTPGWAFAGATSIFTCSVQPNVLVPFSMSGPIVVPPAKGLVIAAVTVGVAIRANLQWFEEDVV